MGIESVLISTRLPARTLMSTSWGEEARRRTHYLFPLGALEALRCVARLFTAPARGIFAALRLILRRQEHGQSRAKMLGLLLVSARLARIASAKRLGHVHVHSCGNAAIIAMFSRLLGGPTYGLTLHNPLDTYGGNQAAKWSNALYGIVITDRIREEVERVLKGHLPPSIAVAPMGVETDRFARTKPYPSNVAGQRFRIVCCARLNFAKGHLDLLDAFSLMVKRGSDVELQIAGEDDAGGQGFRKDVERRIAELGLGDRVTLLGAQPEEKIQELLETAHIFVLASHEEPLGVALMEAMSMEVPVVATNAGGVPTLIRDGVEGLLVPARNAQALAGAIAALIAAPDLCASLGRAGRRRVVEGFSSRRSAQTIFDLVRHASHHSESH
jgi:glycosyltransferase involved in cell wall biosynthesis